MAQLAAVYWMLRQLEMRHQLPVPEERASDAGSQGKDKLDAAALDDREPLHLSVVKDPDWAFQQARERVPQVEPSPLGAGEVRRGAHDAVSHDSRKTHGNSIERP